MNTLSLARAALATVAIVAADIPAKSSAAPILIDISKISVDINDTSRKALPCQPTNISLADANLLNRVRMSPEALWRNPTRTKTSKWGDDELMHVFNGFFSQSITDYEKYETFGKCYTAPDPFKNDDPPYKAAFII